jgi:crotonobetaine/carnitine-CoA ligase
VTDTTVLPPETRPEQSLRESLDEVLEFDFATAVAALDHHVGATPAKVAIHYGETGERLTYADVGDRTDRIAANLVRLGVSPGDRVGVLTTDSLLASLVMFGSWKCGGVYAPVNYQYTGDLLAYVLGDSDPEVLVVDAGLAPAVAEVAGRLSRVPRIVLAGDQAGAGSLETVPCEELLAPAERPDHVVSHQDPANVIYTSGTTGPSKGVVQSHRWVNGYTWVGRRFITPDDVVYNDLPMYHVGGAHFNVARALWVGASVGLWNRFSPHDFWARIREAGCTTAVLLDVMIPWLLNAEGGPDDRRNTLTKVHMQPLPVNHHEFAVRFGIDHVTCGFGQSESGNCLAGIIEEVAEGDGTPLDLYRGLTHAEVREVFTSLGLPIIDGRTETTPKGFMGRPGLFADVAVLDELDRPCPPGAVGQLAIRPHLPYLLFDGYLAKPEATVQSWRNLWFHTGDAAVRREDGGFCFVDRLGDRIRVRGENISSFHIEEILARQESVALAAVVAVPSEEGDEDDVVAFIETAEGGVYDESALRRHCEATMPKFMWPRRYVPVDRIPRTPTNKIEKYKLRQQLVEGTQR